MSDEFTVDEIREAVTLARVYSPGYTEEQIRASMEMGKRLQDSGYLEAVSGIVKLEKEKNVHFTEALDDYDRLLKDKAAHEQNLGDLRVELEAVRIKLIQEQDKLRQLEEAAGRAKTERQKEERELAAFRKKAKQEKDSIDKGLEECRERAKLTEQEVDVASRIKAEVDSRGLSMDLVLGLAQEFAGYEDSRGELVKRLEEHGSVGESIRALETDLSKLCSLRNEEQNRVDSLGKSRYQMESTVAQLRSDAAHEEELRRFYKRYQGVSPLMDHLAEWRQVFFVRCNNPGFAVTGAFSRSMGPARFWTDKPPARCPHCGSGASLLVYDEGLYQALGIPANTPVRLRLGE